ncbi:hypothetical protein NIES970_14110 [[Synechococcus] sp. NIES-970]|nr:hypothetical protein NIES970_14110 [[Synechococcus] sp. NIES-970]
MFNFQQFSASALSQGSGKGRLFPLLSIALVSLGGLSAGLANAKPLPGSVMVSQGVAAESEPAEQTQAERYVGVWALVDNENHLFNVRLEADGSAISTAGVLGVPLAGTGQLTGEQLSETGRWQPWANGVRIDYSDGWTDAILVGPAGVEQWSWSPESDRLGAPTNYSKAVRVPAEIAPAIGVYLLEPTQTDQEPYTASLLSNGQAFNTIDSRAGGVWRLEENLVVIDWISGWRTSFALPQGSAFSVSHWEPGADHDQAPTATRPGRRLN